MTARAPRDPFARALIERRRAERACAHDFLVRGDSDGQGRHADRCVFGPKDACAREYDPEPYREAVPADPRAYEGTGVGLLYGLPGGELLAWLLAGWNLVPGTTR